MFIYQKNIIYLAIAITLSGCVAVAKGVSEGTTNNSNYANLYCKLNSNTQQNELTNPLNIDVYIDGSGSMLGYVDRENSSYIEALKILDSTLNLNGSRSQSTVKYYRSGDDRHKTKELTRSQFRKASKADFYNGKNADLPAVSSDLGSLITKPKDSDRLTVIVTDLEQNDGDVNLIANKIKENYFNNRDENYAVGIWGIKSEFNGTVYSASNANSKFVYDTTGKTSDRYRPFYILFLGNYQDISNYFDKLVKEQGSAGDRNKLLIFSPHNLVAETAYLEEPISISSDLATPSLLHNGKVSVEKNNQPIRLLEIRNNKTNAIEIKDRLVLKQTNHTLSADPQDLKVTISATAFDKFNKKQFKSLPDATKTLAFSDWQLDNNNLDFVTTIMPNELPEANIYYFKVDVTAQDLQKPDWWNEWSLDRGNDGAKTTNLKSFMTSLKNITLNAMNESSSTIGRLCYAIQKD